MAYLSTAVGNGAWDEESLVKNSADDIRTWVNNNINTNETVYRDDFGVLSTDGGNYSNDNSGEGEFAKDALREIDDNNYLTSKENIIIGHKVEGWGYGTARFSVSGIDARVCTVYVGGFVPNEESRLFCWHEAGHNWGADHVDAKYRTKDSTSEIVGATPMIAGYLISSEDAPRVSYCAHSPGFGQTQCWGPDLQNGQPNDPTGNYIHDFYREFDYMYAPNATDEIRPYLDNM